MSFRRKTLPHDKTSVASDLSTSLHVSLLLREPISVEIPFLHLRRFHPLVARSYVNSSSRIVAVNAEGFVWPHKKVIRRMRAERRDLSLLKASVVASEIAVEETLPTSCSSSGTHRVTAIDSIEASGLELVPEEDVSVLGGANSGFTNPWSVSVKILPATSVSMSIDENYLKRISLESTTLFLV